MELEVLPNGERKLVLRQSAFKTFMTCGREFYLEYVRNLEPIARKFSVADTGTFVHAGLQAWYMGKDYIPAIAEVANTAIAENPILAAELTRAANLAQVMVSGYEEWLGEEALDHGLKPIRVEERLEAYIGTYYGIQVWVSGAIDLVVEDVLGQVWIYDHKSVDRFEDVTMLAIDFQGQTYDFLLRANGVPNPAGFIHNRLRRVLRTGNAKPPYFAREEVTFNATQRLTHELHLQGIAEDMARKLIAVETTGPELKAAEVHRQFRPLPTRDCSWRCPMFRVCPLVDHEPEGAEEMLDSLYKQKEAI